MNKAHYSAVFSVSHSMGRKSERRCLNARVGPSTVPRVSHGALRRWGVLYALLGLTLGHSVIIGGFNTSSSDFFAYLLLTSIIISGCLWIPTTPLLFFVFVSISSTAATLFLSPSWLDTPPSAAAVFGDFLKLSVSFVYFTLGVNSFRFGLAQRALGYFSLGMTLSSIPSLMPLFGTAPSFLSFMYYGGGRYRGLVNDPNYYAILASAALAVLLFESRSSIYWRLFASTVLTWGILMSGSKTGAIVLVLVVTTRAASWFLRNLQQRTISAVAIGMLFICSLILLALTTRLPQAEILFPARFQELRPLQRIGALLGDFGGALTADGSGRDIAWAGALEVVQVSPLLGVGFGTYTGLAQQAVGVPVLAHNTFLQLASDWGLLFSSLFGVWLIIVLARRAQWHGTLPGFIGSRAVVLVLLSASTAISLDNTRVFWFALGVAAATQWPRTEAKLDSADLERHVT